MIAAVQRTLAALAAGLLAAIATGLAYGLRAPAGHALALGWRLAGLLTLPGLALGLAAAVVAAGCAPAAVARARALAERHAPGLAALLAVFPPAAVLWTGLAARAGRFFLTAFHHVGLAAMAQAAALLLLAVAVGAASVAVGGVVARRLGPPPAPLRALAVPAAVGLALATTLFLLGLYSGDVHGRGGFLGGYGVLRKPELDLAPVAMLGAVAAGTAALAVALRRVGIVAAVVALGAMVALLRAEADRFDAHPVAAEIDARPGLPRAVLRALRARTDRDRDGFAGRFGGGDCDDGDPRRNPGAADTPGNGVDEDCTGRDAPRPAPRPSAAPPPSLRERLRAATPANMSLVVITVDTMRWDTHYAGRPHPYTPNLDRLAAEGVVFEHGYALSSYTGRAIGPMFTGRYPTECPRDSEHFTRYPSSNVFLAERLRDAGFRTFGAASHFYFEPRFGLAQGMDRWDMSAKPGGDAQETQYADHRVADRVIAMLQRPENTAGRFFLWAHFFDPHKLYVDHPDLPLFGRGERARYDREVMFTDQQIGRVLAALDATPAGRRTVVVVTADHGEAFAEHGMSWHGVELWQELVRVPWIIRVPGVAPRRVAVPRGQIDLAPTLLDLLRLPHPAPDAPDGFSGQSLVGDLVGEPAPARPIYIELPEGPYNSLRRALVFDGWKLTERGARRFELYHLADDPGERANLAGSDPANLARMRALMEQVRGGLRLVPALPRRER